MLLQAESSMRTKDGLIEALAPLHDRSGIALYSRHALCLHDERRKDCVVVNHNSPATAETLDDLDSCCLCFFCMYQLVLLPVSIWFVLLTLISKGR